MSRSIKAATRAHNLREKHRDLAHRTRLDLNKRFTDARLEHGSWTEDGKGGLRLTLEAMDALISQSAILRSAPAYSSKHLLEDLAAVVEAIDGKSQEEAFPLTPYIQDERSAPETAALLLRVLESLRILLANSGDWEARHAQHYIELSSLAVSFLLDSFQPRNEGGGWGIVRGDPPQLVPTVGAIRGLGAFLKSGQLSDEYYNRTHRRLSDAYTYLLSLRQNPRFARDESTFETHDPYSAYGLLGLLDLRHADLPVSFTDDVEPAFEEFSSLFERPPEDSTPITITYEKKRRDRGTAQEYEDGAGLWIWLHSVTGWLQGSPKFYSDDLHSGIDRLLKTLCGRAGGIDEIYLWNRAVQALASYEKRAARYWTFEEYALRKVLFEDIFRDPKLATRAFEILRYQLEETT